MLRDLLILNLLSATVSAAAGASGSGKTTRYWDCCKPSCAWPDKADVTSPVNTCSKDGNIITDANTKSGCDSGTSYMCANQAPWAVSDLLSYGFAATAISGGTEKSWCCACYVLTFTSGKAKGKMMAVQSTNTGGDLSSNQFDLAMPGGGLGIFDGCSSQFGGISGSRYGGVSNISECDTMPKDLQAGCRWRFDWFKNADNPTHTFYQVQCPDVLVNRTGCRRKDDSSYPTFTTPTGTWASPTPSITAKQWEQCDSLLWDAPAKCVSGTKCVRITDYYWQCQ